MKSSKNLADVYRHNLKILTRKVRIASGISPKNEICSNWPSGLQKTHIFPDWPDDQASKTANFVWITPK
jgi:hypothetical protein